jgi:hypothetical protein
MLWDLFWAVYTYSAGQEIPQFTPVMDTPIKG